MRSCPLPLVRESRHSFPSDFPIPLITFLVPSAKGSLVYLHSSTLLAKASFQVTAVKWELGKQGSRWLTALGLTLFPVLEYNVG